MVEKCPKIPGSEFQSSTKIRYGGWWWNICIKMYDVESNGVQGDKQLNGGEPQWFIYNVQYILYSLPPSILKPRLSTNVGSYWWKKSQGQPPFGCFWNPVNNGDQLHTLNWWLQDFWTINRMTVVLNPKYFKISAFNPFASSSTTSRCSANSSRSLWKMFWSWGFFWGHDMTKSMIDCNIPNQLG